MTAPSSRSLRIGPDGCEIASSGAPVAFRWADVASVDSLLRPGERDDLLALRFHLRDGRSVEVDEGIAGFTQLAELLPTLLPGFPERAEWVYETAGGDPADAVLLYTAGLRDGS